MFSFEEKCLIEEALALLLAKKTFAGPTEFYDTTVMSHEIVRKVELNLGDS